VDVVFLEIILLTNRVMIVEMNGELNF